MIRSKLFAFGLAYLTAAVAAAQHPNLSGQWQLNKDLSDDVREKMREARTDRSDGPDGRGEGGGRMGGGMGQGGRMGGPGGGMGGARGGRGGRMGGPGGRMGGDGAARGRDGRGPGEGERGEGMFGNADQMTITQEEPTLVIALGGDRSRSLITDGKEVVTTQERDGVKHTRKTRSWWEGDKLLVESSSDRGKLSEAYELSPGGSALSVTVKVESERLARPVTFLRVYDRGKGAVGSSGARPAGGADKAP